MHAMLDRQLAVSRMLPATQDCVDHDSRDRHDQQGEK